MNIEVKYEVGDLVNYKIARTTSQMVTCPFCNGAKQVQGHDGSVLPCPKCDGNGKVPTIEYREGSTEITGIDVRYNSSDLKSYVNGPRIIYYSSVGNIPQEEIVGKTSSSEI